VSARIGTAGWSIPRAVVDRFPAEGTGLERYAARFDAAEINSTFYRSHRPGTLAKWAAAAPEGFRFAVKAPKAVTHEARLEGCGELLARFLEETAELGGKRGPVLVQLPPKLAFEPAVAGAFFDDLRARYVGPVALEPRHESWFKAEADALLVSAEVARVAADPVRAPSADEPGGWGGLNYWRLHGSPRVYFDSYGPEALARLAQALRAALAEAWCVFDNTASGAAAATGLELQALLGASAAQG
jgi:uncharacterized protein YecE (DUF72 family)